MLQMLPKYKILWFAVDLPNRQGYFFNCSLEQTVEKPGGEACIEGAGRGNSRRTFRHRLPQAI